MSLNSQQGNDRINAVHLQDPKPLKCIISYFLKVDHLPSSVPRKHHLKKNNILAVYYYPRKTNGFQPKTWFCFQVRFISRFPGVCINLWDFPGRKTAQPHMSFRPSSRTLKGDDDVFEDWLNQICEEWTDKQTNKTKQNKTNKTKQNKTNKQNKPTKQLNS